MDHTTHRTHSLRAIVHQLAVKAAPYETRAFLLWTATTAGFAGTSAVRRCPASAHFWGWLCLAVVALTLLALLLDRQSWEPGETEENRASDGWPVQLSASRATPLLLPVVARIGQPPAGAR